MMPRSLDRFFGKMTYRGAVALRGEGAVFRHLAELRALESSDSERLTQVARQRLASILKHSFDRCAWYAERFPGPPSTHSDLEDYFQQIPLLERGDLRAHHAQLLAAAGPRRVTRKTTGGSTGEAVTVVKDREATAREMAASWLAYGWFRVRIGDRAVRLWGDPFSVKRKLRFTAADLAMHRIRFSAFAFDDADLERYWRRCLSFRPDYFYGYVSMLVGFARFLKEGQLDGTALGLKVVICTAEVLHDHERELLEETFGCPVQNEYGCGEVGPIAYSCPENRLHVMSANIHLEVVDSLGLAVDPGESGEIVITDLGNRAMPLIRYRVGDRGILSGNSCPCGRPFPVLERIWGRTYDFVHGPDGKRYHGEFFMYLFEELRELGFDFQRFQIQQTARNQLLVRLLADQPDNQLERLLRQTLLERIPGVQINLAWVDQIPRTPSGKMRVIVNALTEERTVE
jgi:phenylacetate-CoA ligase